MNLEPRILQPDDLEQIYQLEKSKTNPDGASNDIEIEMLAWSASWRKESLEHYLPLGWSYGLFDEESKIKAYAIAQPQLFVHGLTQNLWVEHLYYENEEYAREVLDLLYRTCRDKHFQSIRLKENAWAQLLPEKATPLDQETNTFTFKTAKL